jgi:hypothetical protein
VFAVGDLLVALAELELQLLHGAIDGGVKIRFLVFCEKIIALHAEADGAFESFFGRMRFMVFFQCDPGVDQPPVEVFEAVDAIEDVFLDGLSQRDVVRAENEFHRGKTCAPEGGLPSGALSLTAQKMLTSGEGGHPAFEIACRQPLPSAR